MIGIIIAAIIAVWTIIIGGNPGAVGFLSATGFLWVWHWIWTIVAGVVMLLLMLGFTGTLAFAGAKEFGSKIGSLVGLGIGGTFSALFLGVFAVSRGLLLGGVYLLKTAGTVGMTLPRVRRDKADFRSNPAPRRPHHV